MKILNEATKIQTKNKGTNVNNQRKEVKIPNEMTKIQRTKERMFTKKERR